VILARHAPQGLSALNILPAVISDIRMGACMKDGALVQLRLGEELILARVTRRSVAALDLAVGQTCHAILKSVAVAPQTVNAPPANL
jgi:molybdate transport system ATP-binding protein